MCAPSDPGETTGPLAQWFGDDVPGRATLPVLPPADFAAGQPDLLHRVLDGLRKLS